MTKQTEGPWKVSKLDGRTINGKAYRNLEGNLVTPAIASIKERTGETEANAAFIVQACNCHDELVEALKAASVFIKNGIELGFIRMPDKDIPDPAHLVPGMIETALAKAEGGEE